MSIAKAVKIAKAAALSWVSRENEKYSVSDILDLSGFLFITAKRHFL